MKVRQPLSPANPLPYTNNWTPVMSPNDFLPEEVEKILYAKSCIHQRLVDFDLTIGKLGRNMVLSYFVSGGCIASILQGEEPKDIDIYFVSQFVADPIIKLYTTDPSYMGEVADIDEKYRDVPNTPYMLSQGKMVTENAVTLKNGLQLITKHYGTPDEIRQTFDFVHCMPYYDARNDKLYISREQYNCCVNKCLVINNSANLTTWREDKFIKRGYYYGNSTNLSTN